MNVFLTAYDPTDLPGGSIDPMGFEAGYLHLAEVWLPGLTNVASRPRYFSVLCAGILLAKANSAQTPSGQASERQAAAQRLERLWILANVLASESQGEGAIELGGLRGITYAQARARRIGDRGETKIDANYQLLVRQTQYGLIGLYGAVAERLRMVERKSLILTPDLGEVLGEAFIRETDMPPSVRRAVDNNDMLPVEDLREWGERALVSGEMGTLEGRCLVEALRFHPDRSRAADLIERHPVLDESETELSRIGRISNALRAEQTDSDIMSLLELIQAYERCYRCVMVVFERLMWLGRNLPGAVIRDSNLESDIVLERMLSELSTELASYFIRRKAVPQAELTDPNSNLSVVDAFLARLRDLLDSNATMVDCVLERHAEVQSGKFDRGRRKMPWIERTGDRIGLTLAPASNAKHEIVEPHQIPAHEYRLTAVDWFLRAGRAMESVA